MKTADLFQECLQAEPQETRREVKMSIDIANKICAILKKKKMTQRDLAIKLGKRENEISRWLSGSHNFTISTIAKIEASLGQRIIQVK